VFCVLDIESTGGPFGKEAIMEIALFRYDGAEITDQLISLVHPHREIQKYVSKITGITEKMLIRAPRFHEIAKRILELTEGSVLVGHNVDFDYRMLRQEFERLGYPFQMKVLDTIPLAEKLIPGLASYGLDRVTEELGIFRGQKHRAEGDARATLDLLKILQEKDKEKDISILGQSIRANDSIKDKINDLKRSVKFNRGIFYLHDREGQLLYLGSSDNIKNTINRLFIAENKLAEKLKAEVFSVKTEATGNWLVSQIKRLEESKKAKPAYNHLQESEFDSGIFQEEKESVKFLRVRPINPKSTKQPLVKSFGAKPAYRALRMFKRNHNQEQKDAILEVLVEMPKQCIFQGRGRNSKESCALIIENGEAHGFYFYSLNEQIDQHEKMLKNMTEIENKSHFTELLKLGVLSGEFKLIRNTEAEF
jgi:DNA polymerase-3 subunit epsilon